MSSDSFSGIPETVKIKSGDTLGNLVAKYQVTYDKLKELNPEIFKEGKDAKGRKRAEDGHWIYPGDVIRLRAETATKPASPTTTPTPVTTTANNKVVSAAKSAIDEAKLTPATWAKGREMSEQSLAQAKEMLKLIPASDPARSKYEEKVNRLEREIKAVYPGAATAPATAPDSSAATGAQEAFDAANDNFNQAVQTYHEAESQPAKAESRDLAIRYFSEAHGASQGLSADAKAEANERLEMMEYALTDMGVNASSIALARSEGADSAPATPTQEPSFAERDANQDGYLSGNELDKKARGFDADGNQRVTREEWEMGQMAEREVGWKNEFKQADANQDGWLSGSEATTFRAHDANGDLEVTEQEYLDAKRASVMNGVYDQDFAARDQNQDSYLSGNELDGATQAFDANVDGKVTREEYMAAKSGAQQPASAPMTALPVGQMPAATTPATGVQQAQPTAPANPVAAFDAASTRFNEASTRNDALTMTTAYQDAAYAIAYMPAGTERDTLAAQLEIMGFTLQQAYAASGTPVAAGGAVTGLTAQPLTPGVQVPVTPAAIPGQTGYPAMVPPAAAYPAGYPATAYAQPGAAMPPTAYAQPGVTVPGYPVQAGYPVAATVPQAAAPAPAAPAAPAAPPEPPQQTYTQVWSSPDYLAEAMGYNKQPPASPNGNQSAQGTTTPATDATQGAQNANGNAQGPKPVNEQAVKEIDAFLQRSNADAVRDMMASRPELLYDSLPRQKATMLQLLIEGRTDGGDRQAVVNILDMASQTEQVDSTLNALDSLYGGAGKGIQRMFEDLDQATKGAALKAMFTPSLMQYRQYDQAAFDAVVGAMTKDDIKLLMDTMGYGVSSSWMNVLSPQARQMMAEKLNSGFNLFGLFGGAEKQMVAALQAYTPAVQPMAQNQPQAAQPQGTVPQQ
jgi:hypothetical protein